MKPAPLFFFALATTLIMTLVMRRQGAPLQTEDCSSAGIVSLELVKTTEEAKVMLQCWEKASAQNLIATAVTNTSIDFIYLLTYSLFFFSACMWLSLHVASGLKKGLQYLAVAAIAAGLLDTVENLLMLQTLAGNMQETIVYFTRLAALCKFGLLGVVVAGILIGLLSLAFRQRKALK